MGILDSTGPDWNSLLSSPPILLFCSSHLSEFHYIPAIVQARALDFTTVPLDPVLSPILAGHQVL